MAKISFTAFSNKKVFNGFIFAFARVFVGVSNILVRNVQTNGSKQTRFTEKKHVKAFSSRRVRATPE